MFQRMFIAVVALRPMSVSLLCVDVKAAQETAHNLYHESDFDSSDDSSDSEDDF